jgi:hypothetical protein
MSFSGRRRTTLRTLRASTPVVSFCEVVRKWPDGSYTEQGQGQAILNIISNENLTPGHASSLLNALASLVKLNEIDDLNKPICDLEQAA